MNYKDSLMQSFSEYLNNHLVLLQIVFKLIETKLKVRVCKGKELQEKQLVGDAFFRTLNIGISRVKYYQKKMKDIDVVELDMVKEAQKEMEPLYEIVKERMQTLE